MTDRGSEKSLAMKLGLRLGMRVALVGAPDDYLALLGEPCEGVTFHSVGERPVDVVHLFVTEGGGLEERLREARTAILPNGMVWVSWPKRSSRVATDLTENRVRDAALAAGLVDVKICSVDATWSGLKLVVRLRDR